MKKVILAIVIILWGIGLVLFLKEKVEESESNRKHESIQNSQVSTETATS